MQFLLREGLAAATDIFEMKSFKVFRIENTTTGSEQRVSGRFVRMSETDLDAGDVLIRVHYSSVNHKDAQAATGKARVVRRYPCVGGVDIAGVVLKSAAPRFQPGDPVIATGYEIGVAHHGGYAEYALVPGGWVLPLPAGMNLWEAMAIGTAGFTAAMAISRMEDNGLKPERGSVVVTGASGGVGSLAIDMLAGRGYEVIALTAKGDQGERLLSMGAAKILLRQDLDLSKVQGLGKGLWAGAVDSLGGPVLGWILSTAKPTGVVASVGMVEGSDLRMSVLPFVMRGVSVIGIDSAYVGFAVREQVWGRLASDLRPRCLAGNTRIVEFDDLPDVFDEMMAGRLTGRTVVRVANEEGSHD